MPTRTPSNSTQRRDTQSSKKISFKEFCEIQEVAALASSKKLSQKRLNQAFEVIGDLDIKEVLPMHMMEVLGQIERDMSVETSIQYHYFFRKVFKIAVSMGYISKSPMEHVPCPKRRKTKMTTKLTEVQRKTMLMLIESSRYRAILQLMAIVGVPFNNARCLLWDDLDCARDILHIHYKVDRFEPNPAKRRLLPQSEQRSVHLPPFIMRSLMAEYDKQIRVLERAHLRQGAYRIMFRQESGVMISRDIIKAEVFRIGDAIGIPNLNFTDLNNEAIYLAAIMDIPLVDIMGYFNTGSGNQKLADMYMELRSQRAIARIEDRHEESVWNN